MGEDIHGQELSGVRPMPTLGAMKLRRRWGTRFYSCLQFLLPSEVAGWLGSRHQPFATHV